MKNPLNLFNLFIISILFPLFLQSQSREIQIEKSNDSGNVLLSRSQKMDNINAYSDDEIFCKNEIRTFSGKTLSEVAFPLGGIGAGNVSIGGRGQLRDWEIFNRPAKNRILPYTFFSIWVKEGDNESIARILEARRTPPYSAAFGLSTSEAAGLPRLQDVRFKGEYPYAYLEFIDNILPVKVSLEAYTPFIPLDSKNSSIPAAIFRWKIKNPTDKNIKGTLAFSLMNPIGIERNGENPGNCFANYFGKNKNEFIETGTFRGLKMISEKYSPDTSRFGNIALTTTHKDIFYLTRWDRAGWWDDIQHFWDGFKLNGEIENPKETAPSPDNRTDMGTLGLKFDLKPGEEIVLPFILTWYFPNRINYWDPEPEVKNKHLKNWYGKTWKDSWDIANYVLMNYEMLSSKTKKYHDQLFSSNLPGYVLDAVSSQASIMATTTGLRLDDDKFYAFEGCGNEGGCCPMNCTHVWNYEQALAFLFPDLERTMRHTDFTANLRANGQMAFRTKLPTGLVIWDFRPAADGQMGCILKLYREWKMSGDDKFLKDLWPGAKRAFEYVWDHWDKDKDGVMEDEQHNTYDIEFFGMNTMTSSFYIAALKAMEEMANHLGEKSNAKKYHEFFEKGKTKVDAELFNGEYYIQKYDDKDPKAQKYQYGWGCLSDQMLGQWFAKVAGIGYVFDPQNVKKALESIFKYNWLSDFSKHNNIQRVYALNDEKGLLLCSWPKGNRQTYPFPYSDEVWTGIEYQVAGHLVFEGLLKEGLSIVKGARDRYDGEKRNPWNEVECGNHYARAMASWSVLLALSGYHYDGVNKKIEFNPCINEIDFKSFYSCGTGWGQFTQTKTDKNINQSLSIDFGSLKFKSYLFGLKDKKIDDMFVKIGEKEIPTKYNIKDGICEITFKKELEIKEGEKMTFEIVLK
jgi:uncharacterized protein (DUF608 family)